MKIGVLAIQGDVEEHVSMMSRAMEKNKVSGEVTVVREPCEIESVNALIIPGGESTVISRLLKAQIPPKMPVFGTCAGLILLSKKAPDPAVGKEIKNPLGLMDITVDRNAYGRQRESFEVEIQIPALGKEPFKAVFIRAPVVKQAGKGVSVLASYKENPVLLHQNNLLASTFHPELTDDLRVHEYFLTHCIKSP